MESLFLLAEKEKINITYIQLRKHRKTLWGLYFPGQPGGSPTIYLDMELYNNSQLYRLARCILAEELGHHFTGIRSNMFKIHANYSLERKMSSDDEKALRWATSKLIPTSEITALFKKGKHLHIDLAVYFGVTAWFMFRKMEFLQHQARARHHLELNHLITQIKISCL